MVMILVGVRAYIPALLCLVLLPEAQTTPIARIDVKEDGSNINKTVAMTFLRSSSYILNLLAKVYPDVKFPTDCEDVLNNGQTESGVYEVRPISRISTEFPVKVYCDMEDDGGGWTVIQRRGNNHERKFFEKNWGAYKRGFGDLLKDFWLGNDNIYSLTNQKAYSLKIKLKDNSDRERYALYDTFWIDDEDRKYMLHINGYSGNAGETMKVRHNEATFTTTDKISINKESIFYGTVNVCLQELSGGWWIKDCYGSNLNGVYNKEKLFETAILWSAWSPKEKVSFKATEMKIRERRTIIESL